MAGFEPYSPPNKFMFYKDEEPAARKSKKMRDTNKDVTVIALVVYFSSFVPF